MLNDFWWTILVVLNTLSTSAPLIPVLVGIEPVLLFFLPVLLEPGGVWGRGRGGFHTL